MRQHGDHGGLLQRRLAAEPRFQVAHLIQVGLPPRRIDILTSISGVSFEEAWPHSVTHETDGLAVPFLGRQALVRNKRASGRAKDLADLEALGEAD